MESILVSFMVMNSCDNKNENKYCKWNIHVFNY